MACATAFFIFFATSTRTRIVSADLLFNSYRLCCANNSLLCRAKLHKALVTWSYNLNTLHRLCLWNCAQNTSYCIITNSQNHFIKEVSTCDFILVDRISLSIGLKSDAISQIVHSLEMIHPFFINIAQQNNSFKLSCSLLAEELFLAFPEGDCSFKKSVKDYILILVGIEIIR